METGKKAAIKVQFVQGNAGNVKGRAFIYSAQPSGLITVFAAPDLADFQLRSFPQEHLNLHERVNAHLTSIRCFGQFGHFFFIFIRIQILRCSV